jgi:protein phosphatase
MGGQAAGEVASSLACKTIHQALQACTETDNRAILARNLRNAVRQANHEIYRASVADKKLRGMGTTVSAVAIVGNTAVLAQVGDSRVYVLRGDRLTQITRDQSVVAALVQSGQLSEERAPYSMQRGRVLQALGNTEDIDVSLSIAELRDGDRILLSSDGLHEFVSHEAITSACAVEDLAEAANGLIELSFQAGGADNVSVILAEVRGGELAQPMAGDDELRFTELDPSLEGEMALSTTSMVARRLAHKAGLRKDGWPLTIPATSQHSVVTGKEGPGPAHRAFQAGGRISIATWTFIACIALAALFFSLSWL